MNARAFLINLTPPAFLQVVRWVRRKATDSRSRLPIWEYVPEGWARGTTDRHVTGWNVPAVREWHKKRFEMWSHSFEAPRPLGGSEYAVDSSTQHLHSHNVHLSFAYVLALAAQRRTNLSILDWGGGIGQYYLLSRQLLPDVALSYHCKDVPLICAVGRELVGDVRFYEDESCLERTYDLVIASNSLQYSEDWQGLLGRLLRAASGYAYVAQLPTVLEATSFVAVQRPYAHGFDTEYLGWIFNREEFLVAVAAAGLQLKREFFFGNTIAIRGISEPAVHRGFLLSTS